MDSRRSIRSRPSHTLRTLRRVAPSLSHPRVSGFPELLYPNAKARSSHIFLARLASDNSPAAPLGTAALPTAGIYREDYPRQSEPAPRFLSEAVMNPLESPRTWHG